MPETLKGLVRKFGAKKGAAEWKKYKTKHPMKKRKKKRSRKRR